MAFLVVADVVEEGVSTEGLWLVLLLRSIGQGLFMVLLLRLGVLAAIACIWTADLLVVPSLLYNPRSWTGSSVYVVLPLLLAAAVRLVPQRARWPRGTAPLPCGRSDDLKPRLIGRVPWLGRRRIGGRF